MKAGAGGGGGKPEGGATLTTPPPAPGAWHCRARAASSASLSRMSVTADNVVPHRATKGRKAAAHAAEQEAGTPALHRPPSAQQAGWTTAIIWMLM